MIQHSQVNLNNYKQWSKTKSKNKLMCPRRSLNSMKFQVWACILWDLSIDHRVL